MISAVAPQLHASELVPKATISAQVYFVYLLYSLELHIAALQEWRSALLADM